MPDSEGRSPAEADIAEAQAEFDYRKRAFHDTMAPLGGAMEALIRARAKQKFPDATKVVLFGQMNEDSDLSVHVIRVVFPDRVLENEYADDDIGEFDESCWDVLSYCDVFGDDYYNETEIDL